MPKSKIFPMSLFNSVKERLLARKPKSLASNRQESNPELSTWISLFDEILGVAGVEAFIKNPDRTMELVPGRINVKYPLMAYHKIELADSRIGKCIQQRKDAVKSIPFDVYIDATDQRHEEMKEFVRWWLFEELSELDQTLENILDAFGKGFSVNEMMPEMVTYHNTRRVIIKKLLHREPWQFIFDLEGNLRQLTNRNPMYGEPRTKAKHLIFSYRSRYGNPYGESMIGERGFWLYIFKSGGLQYWVKYLNMLGVPPQKAYHDRNATRVEKDNMLLAMRSLQAQSGILIPDTFQHELINIPAGQSGSIFEDLLDWINKEITIGILGQELTTESTENGSYAMARVQERQLQKTVQPDCLKLAEAINEQMIKPIIKFNFGEQDFYPYIKFDTTENVDIKEKADMYKTLYEMGYIPTKELLQDTFDVPELVNIGNNPESVEEEKEMKEKAEKQVINVQPIEVDENIQQQDQNQEIDTNLDIKNEE